MRALNRSFEYVALALFITTVSPQDHNSAIKSLNYTVFSQYFYSNTISYSYKLLLCHHNMTAKWLQYHHNITTIPLQYNHNINMLTHSNITTVSLQCYCNPYTICTRCHFNITTTHNIHWSMKCDETFH